MGTCRTMVLHNLALSDQVGIFKLFVCGVPRDLSVDLNFLLDGNSTDIYGMYDREILQSNLICKDQDSSLGGRLPLSLDEEDAESDLLLYFLTTLKEEKQKRTAKLVEDIGCLEADIEEAEKRHLLLTEGSSAETEGYSGKDTSTSLDGISDECIHDRPLDTKAVCRSSISEMNEARLSKNINQLEHAYFSMRSKIELPETDGAQRSDKDVLRNPDRWSPIQTANVERCMSKKPTDRLGVFFDGLCKYARYSKFVLRGILRNGDLLNSANVICSLGFDRDEEYFAAAGVSKKIKIFEFGSLLNNTVDIHYPVIEMSSKSKLSCVCWNSYIKNYLASTDYDGVVQLWDASTGQGFSQYREHQKRAWSVDFSQVDPTKLASGSDDCSVKIWSINEERCVSTIRNVANVCCVQFSCYSTHLLAFGSADYKIYCYDLRNTRLPWCTLAGHGKAVSYVKFLDPCTLVSASTDSTLKLWDLSKTTASGLSMNACNLALSGHANEKASLMVHLIRSAGLLVTIYPLNPQNFIGLSVSDGYIACGSETNEVYAYYRSLPMPITSHKFGSVDPITGQETGDDQGQFVSSVCWRGKENMVHKTVADGVIRERRLWCKLKPEMFPFLDLVEATSDFLWMTELYLHCPHDFESWRLYVKSSCHISQCEGQFGKQDVVNQGLGISKKSSAAGKIPFGNYEIKDSSQRQTLTCPAEAHWFLEAHEKYILIRLEENIAECKLRLNF
ncbi:hypothetical protein ACLOJK_010122 [Asimina triloba]